MYSIGLYTSLLKSTATGMQAVILPSVLESFLQATIHFEVTVRLLNNFNPRSNRREYTFKK
jgi:hypothetical protein